MKKAFVVYCLLMMIGLLSSVSCLEFDFHCDSPDKYKVTGMSYNLLQIDYSDSTWSRPGAQVVDTVAADRTLVITIKTEIEKYYVSKTNAGFISAALACSPQDPDPDERFTELKIFANTDFDDQHPKGQNLTDLFDFYYGQTLSSNDLSYEYFEFIHTQESALHTPGDFGIVLNKHPQDTTEIKFTIKYYQEGVDLDSIIMDLPAMVLLPAPTDSTQLESGLKKIFDSNRPQSNSCLAIDVN